MTKCQYLDKDTAKDTGGQHYLRGNKDDLEKRYFKAIYQYPQMDRAITISKVRIFRYEQWRNQGTDNNLWNFNI